MENILIVDEDRLILEVIKRIPEREGVVTQCVSSGEETLEKIKGKNLFSDDYRQYAGI